MSLSNLLAGVARASKRALATGAFIASAMFAPIQGQDFTKELAQQSILCQSYTLPKQRTSLDEVVDVYLGRYGTYDTKSICKQYNLQPKTLYKILEERGLYKKQTYASLVSQSRREYAINRRAESVSVAKIAQELGVSRSTVYKYLRT